jgi:hypothetical protein
MSKKENIKKENDVRKFVNSIYIYSIENNNILEDAHGDDDFNY